MHEGKKKKTARLQREYYCLAFMAWGPSTSRRRRFFSDPRGGRQLVEGDGVTG